MNGGAVMRRQVQILGIAGAAVVAGGTLWAIASSDMLGRFGLSSPAPVKEAGVGQRSGEKIAVVPASTAPGAGTARRTPDVVAIEIARIEAGGASVIAGRSPPNHRIVVLANGREIATAVATDEGQWSVVVSDAIAAGPVELSVSATPASGGPVVVSTPRQLVVPPTPPTRVAQAPPVKVWAPPMAAGVPASNLSPAKAAVAPAERPSPPGPSQYQAESRAKAAADKQALEQFAAVVERARTDAAATAKRESSEARPASTTPPLGLGATGPAMATPATATTAAATSAAPTRATSTLPDPAQVPIPVPITFVTDEIELTPDGARAAALLAEYLRLKRPEGISLSGHADRRGSDSYNMDLSKRRLETIERYLRQAGYAGKLSLTPKGKREPYLGVDRTRLSANEVYQADRRVELRLTQ
jgi:outer membrane protein OmpA-like peptidoglycan-associated protein